MTFEEHIKAITEERDRWKALAEPRIEAIEAIQELDFFCFEGWYDPLSEEQEKVARKINPHIQKLKSLFLVNKGTPRK